MKALRVLLASFRGLWPWWLAFIALCWIGYANFGWIGIAIAPVFVLAMIAVIVGVAVTLANANHRLERQAEEERRRFFEGLYRKRGAAPQRGPRMTTDK